MQDIRLQKLSVFFFHDSQCFANQCAILLLLLAPTGIV